MATSIKGLPQAVVAVPDLGIDLLRALAIYGANASGKTSVIRALAYMGHAVNASQRQWSPDKGVPREPFLLDREFATRSSTFEVDLFLEGIRYTYGFEIDSARVLAEWLFAYPNGKRQRWFERTVSDPQPFRFGKNLLGENRAIQNLTRSNSLFLSAAAQNGHQQLLPIFQWFTNQFEFVNPAAHQGLWLSSAKMCEDSAHRARLVSLLSSADLGIVDIEVTEEEMDEKFQKALRTFLASVTESEGPAIDQSRMPRMPRITLKHAAGDGTDRITLPFEDESDGTRALFALSGSIMRALEKGGTLCVDELDSSLHPLLALGVVRLFNSADSNPRNAQLIFNTHDTNLLDSQVLRRDQIWFAEKDRSGATQLYPLSDFQPRKEENLERGYLQGRYGAVPFLGSLVPSGAADGE